ncbi:MAG: NfeD family protein [Chloroflexota bacterium]
MTIASFLTAFGAFGFASIQIFEVSTGVSLLYATGGGLFVGVIAQVLFIYVLSRETSSLRQKIDIIGSSAEVTTPIPADGVGQVALVVHGARATYSARSQDRYSFKQGDIVKIVDLVGSVVFVESR